MTGAGSEEDIPAMPITALQICLLCSQLTSDVLLCTERTINSLYRQSEHEKLKDTDQLL